MLSAPCLPAIDQPCWMTIKREGNLSIFTFVDPLKALTSSTKRDQGPRKVRLAMLIEIASKKNTRTNKATFFGT